MNILVIGVTGLVGTNLLETCRAHGIDVVGTSRRDNEFHRLNKMDVAETRDLIREVVPDAIIDTAAFHAVDDCETQREKAFDVNATGTRNVATAASDVGAHLIYLSTDYVFPGNPIETPYSETDPVAPLNYYAESKYAGEKAAKIADKHTILRPSVIYGLASDNFVTWVLGELQAGNEVSIVDDQISAPTYAPDLARACVDIAEQGITGLFHSTGPQSLSRYEFTVQLAEVYGFDADLVTPISTEELGQKASRPEDSTLDSSKLYETLGYEFDAPREAFERMKNAAESE